MDLLVVAATGHELGWVAGSGTTLVCGIGPVEASAVTAAYLARRRPDAILHVGIAGARAASAIPLGAVVVGTRSTYADLAAAIPVVRSVDPDRELVRRVSVALPAAHAVTIATSAAVGGGAATAPVEAMEGFGVLRAAALAGVPAVEVRTISNLVEERDRTRWDIPGALAALAIAGAEALAQLRR